MKWLIPREAKFSPAFQEVNPLIVPLHSFFQILFPICKASASEISERGSAKRIAKEKRASMRGKKGRIIVPHSSSTCEGCQLKKNNPFKFQEEDKSMSLLGMQEGMNLKQKTENFSFFPVFLRVTAFLILIFYILFACFVNCKSFFSWILSTPRGSDLTLTLSVDSFGLLSQYFNPDFH